MKLKFVKPDYPYDLIATAEWLLGYDKEAPDALGSWRFRHWEGSRRRLAAPLSHYLGEIERFSLDRVPQFDIKDQDSESPPQLLLSQVLKVNRVNDLLYQSLERGTLTGRVYLFLRPDPIKYYKIYLFDEGEVIKFPEESGINGYMVQVETSEGFERWGFTDTHYLEFLGSKKEDSEWVLGKEVPHNYQVVPGVEITHGICDHSGTPKPGFDWLALELAIEIMAQMLTSSSNHTYFGSPFVVSSFPDKTREEIGLKSKVLTGSQDTTTQDTEILQAPAIPDSHESLLDRLTRSFCDHLRISWVPNVPPGDTSSLTLRLLYSKSINTAQALGETYLEGGWLNLVTLLMTMAAKDNLIPPGLEVMVSYEQEIFPPTVTEKSQLLGLAEQLITMGIKPEVALREYFSTLSEDQIQELMIGA